MRPLVRAHEERHRTERVSWLRAAVLGANDGVVSVASVLVGVGAASGTTQAGVLLAGVAALVAGAMSMAAGEYVSVQSQADTEAADLDMERRELNKNPHGELEELTQIYISRGLDADLARQVAKQLSHHDALEAHARDELGITETFRARPLQAALASASAFALGALIPLLAALLTQTLLSVGVATVFALMLLGGLAAYAGGASILQGMVRVTLWGLAAMALTALIGSRFGVSG